MSLIAFTLSMPSNNSWNRKWSGEDNLYCRVLNITSEKKAQEILAGGYYSHSFGDGWVAGIDVRKVDATEARKLRKHSKGFCGYDWMIDNIRMYGHASDKARSAA